MSINAAGEFSLDPFDREAPGDPIGQMIGLGTVVGNVSGGDATISFSLPQQFAYVFIAGSSRSPRNIDQIHRVRLVTGMRVNGIDERYAQCVVVPTGDGGQEENTFLFPKMITLPGSVVPTLTFGFENSNGAVFHANWRALLFDRHTVIAVPSAVWRDWIT